MVPGKEIARKNLLPKLHGLKQKNWIRAAERLCAERENLAMSVNGGKGSHAILRNTDYPVHDKRSVVATFQKGLYPLANKQKFECLLAHGIDEDDIWQALKLL